MQEEKRKNMEMVNLGFDLLLVGVAMWMIMVVRDSGLGGVMGSTLNLITVGAIVLGAAHLIETILFNVVKFQDLAAGEFIHRVIVLTGFVFLILGIQGLGKLRRPN
jgi:hypothetical protein